MENNTICRSEDNHWWLASRTQTLLGLIDRILRVQDLKLLDIVCGGGNTIHHTLKKGGIDGVPVNYT
jgi:hypothetical protein